MGKKRTDDSDEEYYVKKGDRWVPIDLKGGGSKVKSVERDTSEEYFIKRDDRWVKVEGATSTDDILRALKGRSRGPPRETVTTTVIPAPQPPAPEPQEYREYIVVIQPPVPEPEAPPPVAVQPPPAPRGPPRQRAVPNDYHDGGPIQPQRRDVYRGMPPPLLRDEPRYRSPPRRMSPMRMPVIPPPPPVIVRPPPVEDAFELGREAYLREAAPRTIDSAPCRERPAPCARGPPRTTPAPGYYLAGYLYYGDPASKPVLQPTPCAPVGVPAGVPQAPPGMYFAGYQNAAAAAAPTPAPPTAGGGGDCCGYPNHPTSVEMELTEYAIDQGDDGYPEVDVYPGNQGYAAQGYPGYDQGY